MMSRKKRKGFLQTFDYGFGLNVGIVPKDETAREPWGEFWTANRNRAILNIRNQYKLSDRLLTDGELFLLFFVARDGGLATIRTIPPLLKGTAPASY